MWNIEEVLLL
nr:unnamed protein product [Callosobruchus analis]CAI5828524.1 unnamed protein product [Callosobruchus analis]